MEASANDEDPLMMVEDVAVRSTKDKEPAPA